MGIRPARRIYTLILRLLERSRERLVKLQEERPSKKLNALIRETDERIESERRKDAGSMLADTGRDLLDGGGSHP